MAECELIKGCIFFNDRMANMPGTAEMYKETYCKKDNSRCARYLVFKAVGRENVPKDLFPNQLEEVELVVAGK